MFFAKFFLVLLIGFVFYCGSSRSSLAEEAAEAASRRLTIFDPVVGLPYYGDGSQAEVCLDSLGRNLPTAESANWCLFQPQAFERPSRKKKAIEKSSQSSPMEEQAPMLVPQAQALIPESCVVDEEHTFIPDPHGAGWASIGHLEMQLLDQEGNVVRTYIGTGQLIGPDIVLTAGHNLWSRALKTGFSRIIFHPGRVGEIIPQVAHASSFVVHPGYVSGEEEEYKNHDIGVIVLDTPVGYRVGWATYGHAEDDELRARVLAVVGYPSIVYEKKVAKMVNGTQMFHMAGPVLRVTETQVYYGINTFGGHSGSGVLDEGRCIRAIHTYGGTKETGNCGTRISRTIEGLIKEWSGQFASNPHLKAPPAFQTRRAIALSRTLTAGKAGGVEEGSKTKLKAPLKRLQSAKKEAPAFVETRGKPMKKESPQKRKHKKNKDKKK
jgi:V8-like Glu-specific endopeptidase